MKSGTAFCRSTSAGFATASRLSSLGFSKPGGGTGCSSPRRWPESRPGPGGGAYAASKHAVVAIAEQAALSLVDTPVSVTLLCPALVRSGMSPVGEDPALVAQAALAACREGRFAVIPDEWHPAVLARATRLTDGTPPVLPQPSAPNAPAT